MSISIGFDVDRLIGGIGLTLLSYESADFLISVQGKRLAVYDSGNLEETLLWLKAHSIKPSYVITEDFWEWNKTKSDLPVVSSTSLKPKSDETVVLITQPYYAFSIEESIKHIGFSGVFCYGFFVENLRKTFKIGFHSQFVKGKAFRNPTDDGCCLAIMLSNKCNCMCPFCSVGYAKSRSRDDMCICDYVKILDDAKGLYVHGRFIDTIQLDADRELFVHSEWKEAVAEINKRGFSMNLVTNGKALTEENSKYLIDKGLTEIIVSVGALDAEKYFYRQGYNKNENPIAYSQKQLDNVIENVKNLISCRNAANSKLTIGIAFALDKGDEYYVKDAIKYWKHIGVDFFWGNPLKKIGDNGDVLELRPFIGYCRGQCYHMLISSDGNLHPCCGGDGPFEDIVLGNVFKTSLKEIVKSKIYNDFYEGLSSLDENKMHPICVKCASGLHRQ